MNSIVLITGAAKGIGKAIAMELAKDHYDIVINYLHSKKEADELRNFITEKYDVRCIAIQCDVSKEEQVDKMISQIEKEMVNVDVLINNAAIDLSNLFHLKTAQEFRKTLDVNVIGAYNCAKRVYKGMLEKGYGKIINIASTNGINTYYPMCFDYDASKAGVISLTHSLARFLAPNIRVNAVAPGWILTDMTKDLDLNFIKYEEDKILLKRFGKSEEIADAVYFLASNEYVNDCILRIDGGIR